MRLVKTLSSLGQNLGQILPQVSTKRKAGDVSVGCGTSHWWRLHKKSIYIYIYMQTPGVVFLKRKSPKKLAKKAAKQPTTPSLLVVHQCGDG